MIFTLEALEAKHGDALLLHHGPKSEPRLVIVDGGPTGVYNKRLKPRLLALRESRSPDAPLPVDLMMVSHIDDDHIQGILDLADDLKEQQDDGEEQLVSVERLWHNSFDAITGADPADLAGPAEAVRSVALGDVEPGDVSREAALILVSVPQGKELRSRAKALGITIPGLISYAGGAAKSVKVGDTSLSLQVLGPNEARLAALKKEWQATKKKKKKVSDVEWHALAAEFVEKTVSNLSSIVALARLGARSMLLTGDGRGDDLMAALKSAKLLKDGTLHVDVLKMPHHGSVRNVALEFFQTITADHYLISADGRFSNPDVATLDLIAKARGKSAYTVYVTNSITRADTKLKAMKAANPKLRVVVRKADEPSVKVELGDPIPD
jgi:glyoxylase-like metal-dependent hydrolase (beta-lactamase superfamily II)